MKSLKHIVIGSVLGSLMLSTVGLHADQPPLYRRVATSLCQKTKRSCIQVRDKVRSVVQKIARYKLKERDLQVIFFISYLSLHLLVRNLNYLYRHNIIEKRLLYTHRQFKEALRDGDTRVIDDYLDNKRLEAGDCIDGDPLLLYVAKQDNLRAVKKLLDAGVDPRPIIASIEAYAFGNLDKYTVSVEEFRRRGWSTLRRGQNWQRVLGLDLLMLKADDITISDEMKAFESAMIRKTAEEDPGQRDKWIHARCPGILTEIRKRLEHSRDQERFNFVRRGMGSSTFIRI